MPSKKSCSLKSRISLDRTSTPNTPLAVLHLLISAGNRLSLDVQLSALATSRRKAGLRNSSGLPRHPVADNKDVSHVLPERGVKRMTYLRVAGGTVERSESRLERSTSNPLVKDSKESSMGSR